MKAYSGFAEVYDTLMDDFDYPKWAEYYLSLFNSIGVQPKTLYDCACGTGSVTVELAQRGISVTGIDLSPDMLELAAQKTRRRGLSIRYVCADISQLRMPRPADAVICACDGVNYLTSEKAVAAFFARAYESVRPGGGFAFDISTPYKLREVMGDGFFGEERENVAYLWQNTLNGDIIDMDLTFFIREESGLYRRVAENHRQRIHRPDRLKAMLVEAGFTEISVFGDMTTEPPKHDDMRIHFLAKKAIG